MSKKEEYVTPDVEFILMDALTCVKGLSSDDKDGGSERPTDPFGEDDE